MPTPAVFLAHGSPLLVDRPMSRVRLVVPLALALALVFPLPARVAGRGDDVVGRYLAYPTGPHSYRAHRHIEASGASLHAAIEADTDYSPAAGLHYTITSEEGSRIIRSRVLVPLLEREQRLIARGAAPTVALSPANYDFMAAGQASDGLARIEVQPLRKEQTLIEGELLVKPSDGELVQLDGRLARNPSFWTRRVDVVRQYERINGIVMPVSLESVAQLRLFGRSTLRMTYEYIDIDGHAVANTPTN